MAITESDLKPQPLADFAWAEASPTLVITTDYGVDEIIYGGQLFQCENCDGICLMTLAGLRHWHNDGWFCEEWNDEIGADVTSELHAEPLPYVDLALRPF